MNTLRSTVCSARCSKSILTLSFLFLPFTAHAYVTESIYVHPHLTPVEMSLDATAMSVENAATETVYYFVASLRDGSELSYPFAERPTLTNKGTDLLLTTTKGNLELPHGSVQKFTIIAQQEATGIKKVKNKAKVEWKENVLHFVQCRVGSIISVYDKSGRMVLEKHVDEDGVCCISLQAQPSGIYVIKSENVTCKILKK